jgi:hypothetical protein
MTGREQRERSKGKKLTFVVEGRTEKQRLKQSRAGQSVSEVQISHPRKP